MPLAPIREGLRLNYEWHGDESKPPVVFIRGTGADGTRWMPQVRAYESHFRCLIFDNRGVGKSDTPAPPYSVDDMASDTLLLMEYLGIERAHLAGSSLGGAVALHIAAKSPDKALTLQLHSSWLATRGYAAYSLGLLKRLFEVGGVEFYYEATLPLLFSPKYLSENFDSLMGVLDHMKSHPASTDGMVGQLAANLSHDLSSEAKNVKAPTLITVGELDSILPVMCSEDLQRAIPNAELAVLPGSGHLASMEDSETFNRVTLEWLLKQQPAATP